MSMTKRYYDEAANPGGVQFLNSYPKFITAPPTIAFALDRELEIVDRARSLTEAGIERQRRSYEKEGEFQPVLIRIWPTAEKGGKHAQVPRLIDGAHRIKAAKRLALETIMALFVECSDDEAKAMEIAANAFRTELTRTESGSQMIEWCRLHGLPLPGELGAEGGTVVAPQPDPGGDVEVTLEPVTERVSRPDDGLEQEAKVETPFHFPEGDGDGEPEAVSVEAPTELSSHARPGRGHKGTVAKVAEAFGVSKPTARACLAAAQGKPPKPPKPKPALAAGLERACRDAGVPDARIEGIGGLPLSEQGSAAYAAQNEAVMAQERARGVERERAADKGPSEVMKANDAAVAMILKDIRDRSALLAHLEQVEKGHNHSLFLKSLLSGLREPARAA
jgi:hypothetical protein